MQALQKSPLTRAVTAFELHRQAEYSARYVKNLVGGFLRNLFKGKRRQEGVAIRRSLLPNALIGKKSPRTHQKPDFEPGIRPCFAGVNTSCGKIGAECTSQM